MLASIIDSSTFVFNKDISRYLKINNFHKGVSLLIMLSGSIQS